MDVAWQDGGGSYLDWSGNDLSGSVASLASGDGSVLWSSSGDTPVFSGDSMLWQSSGDAPSNGHLAAFDPETDGKPASSWITSGTSGPYVGSSSLDSGLLWAGAGDTSYSLANGAGSLGSLGALDLGAGNASSQWQQFVADFGGQSMAGINDLPQHLLWTGASGQQPLVPPVTSDFLHISSSFATPTVPTIAPENLMWTDPFTATGLTAGPSLGNGAPFAGGSASSMIMAAPGGDLSPALPYTPQSGSGTGTGLAPYTPSHG